MPVRPRVGISADYEARPVREVATFHHVLQHYYIEAVLRAGGLPVVLPSVDPALVPEYAAGLDALVVSGGDFDLDPALFGEARHERLGRIVPERTAFEMALLRHFDAGDKPVLGICGGMQAMNVLRGGSLYQDLPSQKRSTPGHSQIGDKRLAWHNVSPSGVLADWIGAAPLPVNSTHHQAVKTLGAGLVAAAVAEDGIVEAFVDPKRCYFVGVQWHPEAMAERERHDRIYARLVAAAHTSK
ncbi:MAG: gamma-glutamyl-gamma-aminobutyrate hydrolase family protein [Deltaproteobacteria bacterium]|nr:gamma-glutamyl-gamma-aminobutyrate hydrolase family protein [Deltaproteobacteria bacterium]